jgi:organic hydroperoxide reductase OsmC/OhrA
MAVAHHYAVELEWTGNLGAGTADYRSFARDHEVRADGKPTILGSSDPAFRGEVSRWNPEELLVVSLAQCHLLWYLHLCATAGVVVTAYSDSPTGTMVMDETGGGGQFREVTLRPSVVVAAKSMIAAATAIHGRIGDVCFIARSVNFPVHHEPTIRAVEP